MEVKMVEIKKKLSMKKSPCKKCPYKLGVVQTIINPCPQCKIENYKAFEEFRKQQKKKV